MTSQIAAGACVHRYENSILWASALSQRQVLQQQRHTLKENERCSTPIAAAASKLPFQLAAVVFAVYLLYESTGDIARATTAGREPYSQAQVVPASLRDGSPAGAAPSFADFGLLVGGCKVPPPSGGWSNGTFQVHANPSLTKASPHATEQQS